MTRILADAGDERKVIEEERQNWLHRVLIAFGADENIISKNTLEAKRHISQLNLDVDSNVDGSINIFRLEISSIVNSVGEIPVETRRQLVAQWLPPDLIRIKERPKDYYIISLKEWALPFQMD